MKKDYVVLSLDPMYSSLHEKIAQLVAKEKYAVTSCWSKKIYLPSFPIYLAATLINQVTEEQAKPYYDKIKALPTYHHAFVQKREGRALTLQEISYMARFYVAIKAFIIEKGITLLLVNNDTRWYHAIAIEVCRELEIRYLVTEQGLIRPYTTVIDPKGVNAYADIRFDAQQWPEKIENAPVKFTPQDKHDSLKSMAIFALFLLCFASERVLGSRTILRYMHNNYSLQKYGKRLINRIKPRTTLNDKLKESSALLLLQLEYDSQILLHSPFESNQEIIQFVENITQFHKMNLAIKAHPLDMDEYRISENSYWVDGNLRALTEQAQVVFTVNSSAVIDVLHTNTPLLLMGESIFAHQGIAAKWCTQANMNNIIEARNHVDIKQRQRFVNYLSQQYLLVGAGYSYSQQLLQRKLKSIL
ncbi:MAG: hypothetical protein R3Y10_05160 [Ferrimonas sp.]